MRVVIRADATPRTGTGHVMRCWALAEEFASRGWEVEWHGEVSVPWLQEAFAATEWSLERPDGLSRVDADIAVVDSYTLSPDYRQGLLASGVAVVAIVDDFHRHLGPGTLWVNPGAPAPLGTGRRFLNGPDYVLIRREIRALKGLRESTEPHEAVTFLLGGTDFAGLGAGVEALDLPLPIYAGPGAGAGSEVHWLPGGRELLQQAATSRLVVSAAGVSSWEMLHVGVPLALVMATENQRGNYEWMTTQGWAAGLGTSLATAEELIAVARESPASEPRIDGLGAQRVVEAILDVT